MRYYEVTASWGMLVAVDAPDGPEHDEAAEQAAVAYFCDELPIKELMRGAEAEESEEDPGSFDVVVRPAEHGSYEWVDKEE